MNENLIKKFGFTEMYEWYEKPNNHIGLFVTLSKELSDKIVPFGASEDDYILGVSTVCSVLESDDPDEWQHANISNEVGDVYLQVERLAVGEKKYDQLNEMNYIETRMWEHYIPIKSDFFDSEKKYTKRSSRGEWVRVNLVGKCIVRDNGTCRPGGFCKPYVGKFKENWGTAIPAEQNDKNSFYVLNRLTDKTILIVNK